MKPTLSQLTKLALSCFDNPQRGKLYYLDGKDYSFKTVNKKSFNEFRNNYLSNPLPTSEKEISFLYLSIILCHGKYLLPEVTEKDVKASYSLSDPVSYDAFRSFFLKHIIYSWLDKINLYAIETPNEFYFETFKLLHQIYENEPFYHLSDQLIISRATHNQVYYYKFDRNTNTLTVSFDRYAGDILYLGEAEDPYTPKCVKQLREAFEIRFVDEDFIDQDALDLFSKYECKECDFGPYIPELHYVNFGMNYDYHLRFAQCSKLSGALMDLINIIPAIIDAYPNGIELPGVEVTNKQGRLNVDEIPEDEITCIDYIQTDRYEPLSKGVKKIKGLNLQYHLNVAELKPYRSNRFVHVAVFESVLADLKTDDVVNSFTCDALGDPVSLIASNLIEYFLKNGAPERFYTNSFTEGHILHACSNNKSKMMLSDDGLMPSKKIPLA